MTATTTLRLPGAVLPRTAPPRWRRLVLLLAIAATAAAAALLALDHAAQLARLVERVGWTLSLSPARAVDELSAVPGYESLALSWAAEDRAVGYTVEIAEDEDMTADVEHLSVDTTRVVIASGLAQGTTYYYRVSWTSAAGNVGAVSPVQSVTTPFRVVTAPTAVAVTSSSTAFALSWDPVDGATDYVVRMSTSSDPSAFGQSAADVEFSATTATSLSTDAIDRTAGDSYYFTVRAENGVLSSASAAPVAARLAIPAPASASIDGTSTSGATISWQAVDGATSYLIEWSTSADFTSIAGSDTVPESYLRSSVYGLTTGTEYFFRVHGVRDSVAGDPSPVVAATTGAGAAASLRVATYNVLDPVLGKSTLGSWSSRRENVAATIDAADADIIGLQEANWSRLADGGTAAEDLQSLLDKTMTLSKAGYRSDALLYDASKYAAGDYGHFDLPYVTSAGTGRDAIWQIFRDKKTGLRFLVVSTHLAALYTSSDDREVQAERIVAKIAKINTAGLPVVILGDLNSYDGRSDVTPMSVFAAAGYTDAELTTPETTSADVNTWVKATSTTGAIRFDHIAVSDEVAVTRTEVEDPDLDGPASDHRLLWADVAIAAG
ncbi:MAG: endonuclease/exonuclease/phosphatase family protein [Microbacteriaceae bacterium]